MHALDPQVHRTSPFATAYNSPAMAAADGRHGGRNISTPRGGGFDGEQRNHRGDNPHGNGRERNKQTDAYGQNSGRAYGARNDSNSRGRADDGYSRGRNDRYDSGSNRHGNVASQPSDRIDPYAQPRNPNGGSRRGGDGGGYGERAQYGESAGGYRPGDNGRHGDNSAFSGRAPDSYGRGHADSSRTTERHTRDQPRNGGYDSGYNDYGDSYNTRRNRDPERFQERDPRAQRGTGPDVLSTEVERHHSARESTCTC